MGTYITHFCDHCERQKLRLFAEPLVIKLSHERRPWPIWIHIRFSRSVDESTESLELCRACQSQMLIAMVSEIQRQATEGITITSPNILEQLGVALRLDEATDTEHG